MNRLIIYTTSLVISGAAAGGVLGSQVNVQPLIGASNGAAFMFVTAISVIAYDALRGFDKPKSKTIQIFQTFGALAIARHVTNFSSFANNPIHLISFVVVAGTIKYFIQHHVVNNRILKENYDISTSSRNKR